MFKIRMVFSLLLLTLLLVREHVMLDSIELMIVDMMMVLTAFIPIPIIIEYKLIGLIDPFAE